MALKRMIVEFGMGTDIRGSDDTKAAVRAVRDALWHNTINIAEALGQPREAMQIEINIGTPNPTSVNRTAVAAVLPYGHATINVIEGGLKIMNDAGTDATLIANAAVIVRFEMP
jgi:uncharacterized protein (TIGR02058 family)